jgi:hypothetical protein
LTSLAVSLMWLSCRRPYYDLGAIAAAFRDFFKMVILTISLVPSSSTIRIGATIPIEYIKKS